MARLADLVDTSTRVARESGRLAKVAALAGQLRTLGTDEVALAVAWLSGELLQRKLGIGGSALRASRVDAAPVASLTLREVDDALNAIASASGAGSTGARRERLQALLGKATPEEQSFLVRLLAGELRQGALDGLMIDAVASAAGLEAALVRRAAHVGGGVAAIAPIALREGAAGLARYRIALFRPVAPMLAQPAEGIADAWSRVEIPAIEWKLDGARVQVHRQHGDVRVYSRTGNDVTAAVPEVVAAALALPVRSVILDGEAIALRADRSPWPFQDTMRRFGRTADVDAMRATMPLSPFFFDCLAIDDADLTGDDTLARRAALDALAPEAVRVPRLLPRSIGEAQAFYDDVVRRGHEGVMVKARGAAYAPGTRSADWLKVKRAHTLDLVVLAAEWGNGRREGTLSNLHLGARDPSDGSFVMLGKTFKGLTDETLAWQTRELLAREIGREGHVVHVRPELVVEIAFNDLQASPRYPGGLALRFARVKGYRPDKRAEDADTIETVREIHAAGNVPR